MEYYNRYKLLRKNNVNYPMPMVDIPISPYDKRVVYKKGITRFDILSQEYYENPLHGFLIMCANKHIVGMEFDIEDGTEIRIPFPFKSAISLYNDALKEYITIQGLDNE